MEDRYTPWEIYKYHSIYIVNTEYAKYMSDINGSRAPFVPKIAVNEVVINTVGDIPLGI